MISDYQMLHLGGGVSSKCDNLGLKLPVVSLMQDFTKSLTCYCVLLVYVWDLGKHQLPKLGRSAFFK